MADFTKISFDDVSDLNTSEEEEILFKEVLEGLLADPELAKEFSEFIVDPKKIRKLVLPLYRIVQDRKPCRTCRSLYTCPKKDWKGYKLSFNPGNIEETKHFRCPHQKKYEIYQSFFDFTSYDPYIVLRLFSKMMKDVEPYVGGNKEKSKSSMINSSVLTWKKITALKGGNTKYRGFNFTSSNDNRLSLAFFTASIAVYYSLRCSLINVDLLNKFYLDRNIEGFNSLLDDIKSSDIYVITNLDRSLKQTSYVDAYLLPILRQADNDGKMLFTSSAIPLEEIFFERSGTLRGVRELLSRRLIDTMISDDKLYTI